MKIMSYEFNMDTAYVELQLTGGTLISVDCIAVENGVVDNIYQWPELESDLQRSIGVCRIGTKRRSRNLFESCNRV